MKKILYIALLAWANIHLAMAQTTCVNVPHIKTLQVVANDNWMAPPIIHLNTADRVEISFDELTHEYHRYTYKITHCNADWTPSDLFDTDYLQGFNDNVIEDWENSLNTTMLYTHYRFTLPNDEVQLLLSGNYRVDIFGEDNEETPVAQASFSVIEPRVGVSAEVSSNTDIDTNESHQQVSFTVNYPGMNVTSPQAEFKTRVYQNLRTDNCVTNLQPTYLQPGQMQFVHNRRLIFPAGNEYRRFEIFNLHYGYQDVEQVQYFNPYYHATLYPDQPRTNYSYDQDQDGRFFIRYDMADDTDTEADYLFVHFTLEGFDNPLPNGRFYLNGNFTYGQFTPSCALTYNEQTRAYEGVQLLKMGVYNWLYLFVPEGSTVGQTAPASGNFYETENEYLILVYHRPFGGRYDKLVGLSSVKFEQE
ncbi:MAG: DUF5103 domain-containing protein [Bacteroidaceae bacterium]|nr:DUF5103 domain-containing protein [Bacteroidaceae bacterium]